ncbi:MAG: SDR family oxidoreductase [Alphaproteobacteria bacterium]|nr:SDR family oxidoreductase [Alphaproteobacteria bacterium]
MLFDLDGKVAVITGSSRGIGRAIAERFAEAGARVAISSRKAEACEATAAAINAAHGEGRAIACAASLGVKDDLARLVGTATARLGPIDILVCNAATNPHFGPLIEIDDARFRKILENNVLANHWLVQMVAPSMMERRDGVVIVIESLAAVRGIASVGAYGVSKAAGAQLVRALAIELGPHNIRVNGILPGYIATDFSRALWEDPTKLERIVQATPLRRIGTPDDVSGAAVYLASAAGRFVTGQTIVVDGGVTSA